MFPKGECCAIGVGGHSIRRAQVGVRVRVDDSTFFRRVNDSWIV